MLEFFIKRKVSTAVVFSLILLFGLISLSKLKIDLLPDISFPTLTVITIYSNVAPSEMETLVTKPIEEIVSSVSGVDRITSESIEGVSLITVRFRWGTDMDQASIQTREKVDLVKGSLPQDVKKSIVIRFNPNDAPIMQLAVEATGIPLKDARFFIKKNIIPYFERVDGIAAISVSGGLERQIQFLADKGKLESYNISLENISGQLSAGNFNFPAGNIKHGDKEILVRTNGAFNSMPMIGDVVVGITKEGIPIYLKSIGEVVDSFKERTSISKFNENECIALVLKKEAGKNTVAISESTRNLIDELNLKFKGKIHINIVSDQSVFIRESITSVATSALLSIIICYFVLSFFLGSFREPFIVISSVPASMLLTFIFMYSKDISLNTMSLGGLATGVGMLVDSTTIVIESIYQKSKEIPDKITAAIVGTKEVSGSIIGGTITSCVVFIPIVFVEGMAGAIFGEFAMTISFSLISSLIVSMTLVPVMTLIPFLQSDHSKQSKLQSTLFSKRDDYLENTRKFFVDTTLYFHANRQKLYFMILLILPLTFLMYFVIPGELMPEIDQGQFTIKLTAKEGTRLNATNESTDKIVSLIRKEKIAEKIFSKVGYEEKDMVINPKGDFGLNRAEIFVKLNDTFNTDEAISKIRSGLAAIENNDSVKLQVIPAKSILSDIFSGADTGITIEVSGNDLNGIKRISKEIETELFKIVEFTDITTSFRDETPELLVELDRDKMAFFGINVENVAKTLKGSLKGEVATKYRENDYEFDIFVRLREGDRSGVDSLENIYIKAPTGKSIKLTSFAKVAPSRMSRKIIRADGKKVGMVFANYKKIKQSEATNLIQPILDKYETEKEFSVVTGEVNKETNKSFRALGIAGIMAIILVYMTMASQFENYILPLVVMLSILMNGVGVGFALLVSGNTLNIISMMGIVMLAGLVVNNAIILIEYFQQYEKSFKSDEDLITSSISRRLNTILNTTATSILGLIPAAFAIGGQSPQEPMAVSVIGGLLVSTILTLIIIPLAYLKVTKPFSYSR